MLVIHLFIFSDNDVVMESFLEDLQNMFNGGVVPNLHSAEDLGKLNFRNSLNKCRLDVAT
jgi:hypothetical protein